MNQTLNDENIMSYGAYAKGFTHYLSIKCVVFLWLMESRQFLFPREITIVVLIKVLIKVLIRTRYLESTAKVVSLLQQQVEIFFLFKQRITVKQVNLHVQITPRLNTSVLVNNNF